MDSTVISVKVPFIGAGILVAAPSAHPSHHVQIRILPLRTHLSPGIVSEPTFKKTPRADVYLSDGRTDGRTVVESQGALGTKGLLGEGGEGGGGQSFSTTNQTLLLLALTVTRSF